jgi:hypothetical protein
MMIAMWRWIGGLAIFVLGLYTIRWGWIGPHALDGSCQYQNNALWLSVDWTSAPVQQEAMELLAGQVQGHRVHYLYPYVSYLKEDGTWSRSYNHASDFLAAYRSLEPDTRILAWIGIPLQNTSLFGVQGWVDLQEVATRRQIADFVRQMIDLGFDGIHLNVESVLNDDPAFLSLLQEVRAGIGDPPILSIAGAHWVSTPIGKLPVVGALGWQSNYYSQVALRVDQIVTMTYDSHLPTAALYRLWLREQIRGLSTTLKGLPVEVLWGLSVSRERTPSHQPDAESLASGLTGICAGLETKAGNDGNLSAKPGVALYAAWEMTQADWEALQEWQ